VIGTVRVAGPNAPEGWPKDDHGKKKEDAADFEPQDAAHPAKRAQKAADTAGKAAAGLAGRPSGGAGWGGRGNWLGRWPAGRRLCAARHALARDAPGYAQADAQGAADGLGSHSVYDGSSAPAEPFFTVSCTRQVAPKRQWT
jgi:hypothetical protein